MELLIFLVLLGGIVGLALFKKSKKNSTKQSDTGDDMFIHPDTHKTSVKTKSVKAKQ